jgi:hypothetical protein
MDSHVYLLLRDAVTNCEFPMEEFFLEITPDPPDKLSCGLTIDKTAYLEADSLRVHPPSMVIPNPLGKLSRGFTIEKRHLWNRNLCGIILP